MSDISKLFAKIGSSQLQRNQYVFKQQPHICSFGQRNCLHYLTGYSGAFN